MNKTLMYLFLSFLFLYSCTDSATIPLDEKGNEDFIAFHKKFYSDSLFQLQRIEFPMLGNNPNGDGGNFIWDIDNWQYKRAIIEKDEDIEQIPFVNLGGLIRERLLIQKRFMIENLFTLIDNKWYMTYYSGVNDIGYYSNKKGNKPSIEDNPSDEPPIE